MPDSHLTDPCQCEHADHFERSSGQHRYGQFFAPDQIKPIQTIMGTFKVCPACAQYCYGPNSGVRK